jgi:hypothetical protein
MLMLFSELSRVFEMEMPPLVKGLSEVEVRKKNSDAISKLKSELRAKFEQMMSEKGTK